MSRHRSHPKQSERIEQIARRVKLWLIVLIAFLVIVLLALQLGAGQADSSGWLARHHAQVQAAIVLVVVILIVTSPLLIEALSNMRALSGPGKNPEGPNLG